jgi:hypothetical protein
MLLTEKEAAMRWCPFTRTYAEPGHLEVGAIATAVNRGPTYDPCRCLGSGCMAWRWSDADSAFGKVGECGLARASLVRA